MPVLPADYISAWHYYTDSNGGIRLFERYEENQKQEVTKRPMLAGDIGTRVMNIGGLYCETQISSPVVLIDVDTNDPSVTQTTSVIDIVKDAFSMLRYPDQQATAPWAMRSAEIRIDGKEGVSVDITLLSDTTGIFTVQKVLDLPFIARSAVWYDTSFNLTAPMIGSYMIKSGTISIEAEIDNVYLIGQGPIPYFGITGYQVSGSIEILATPFDTEFSIIPQPAGALVANGTSQTALVVGGATLGISQASVNRNIKRALQPTGTTSVNVDFLAYANQNTIVTQ